MLLIRSRSTGVPCCVDRQQVLALARPGVDLAQLRRRGAARRARLRRRALDELLADQRLRADRAVRVLAEAWKPGSSMLQDDRRLLVRRDVERLDRADLGAGDLHVLARDHERGVVEDRPDPVAAAAVARRPWRARPARPAATRHGDRWRRRASLAGRTSRGIAVEGAVGVTPRRGAVGRRLDRGARAALDDARRSPRPATRSARRRRRRASPVGLVVARRR